MKSKENRAVTRCYQNGIAVTRNEFRKALKEYNNYEMPLSNRMIMIGRNWDSKFFEFLKKFLNEAKLKAKQSELD